MGRFSRWLRWPLRLLLWLIWPRRRTDRRARDEEPPRRPRRRRAPEGHPGVFRIEVDHELGRFHGEGPAFSFWSSSRIILILALLLWWIQPAGPMIAGYVGGRRAGSPWKAVVAALLPVFAILLVNYAYTHSVAARQIDFVASIPLFVGDGIASVLPFLAPYRDFMIAYLQSFVEALRTTFGMGTNGYLMVILFAYIGGLLGEQVRRELAYRGGAPAAQSVGLNLPWPFFHARAPPADDGGEEEADEDEGYEPRPHRRPVRAARGVGAARRHRGRGRGRGVERFEDLRKLPVDAVGARADRRRGRARRAEADEDESEEDEEDEDVEPVRTRRPARFRARRADEEEEEPEPHERPARRESRPVKVRSREEELAIQRFVERALRNYDHSRV